MKRYPYLVLLMLFFLPLTVHAQEESILTIRLKDLGTDRTGVVFEIFQVGRITKGQPVIDRDFSVEKYPQKAWESDEAAQKISALLTGQHYGCAITDTKGTLSFSSLEDGVYLVRQSGSQKYGTISPFLVYFPCHDENRSLLYQLEIEPKASVSQRPDEEIPYHPSDSSPKKPEIVQTGDTSAFLLFTAELLCSLLILCILPTMKKRGDKL